MRKTILLVLTCVLVIDTYAQKTETMNSPKINFEILKQDHWSDQEKSNVSIIADFVQHIMNDHNFDYILKNYGDSRYLQHNKGIPDGVAGLVEFIKNNFAKRYPEYSYDVKWIVASGDMVITHSHVTTKAKHRGNEKKGFIITDTWRLKDGKIEEHWDAIQAIQPSLRLFMWLQGGKHRNSNTQF